MKNECKVYGLIDFVRCGNICYGPKGDFNKNRFIPETEYNLIKKVKIIYILNAIGTLNI